MRVLPSSIQAGVIAILTLSLQSCASSCEKFIDYKARTVDITGIKAKLGEPVDAEAGRIYIKPEFREASERLQTLDALQQRQCVVLKEMESGPERTKAFALYSKKLTDMMDLALATNGSINEPTTKKDIEAESSWGEAYEWEDVSSKDMAAAVSEIQDGCYFYSLKKDKTIPVQFPRDLQATVESRIERVRALGGTIEAYLPADSINSESSAKAVSDHIAGDLKRHLISEHGIDPSLVEVVSYGKSHGAKRISDLYCGAILRVRSN